MIYSLYLFQLVGFVYACYVVSVFTEEEDSCKYLSTDPLAKVVLNFISLSDVCLSGLSLSDFFPSPHRCDMALPTFQGSAVFTVRFFSPMPPCVRCCNSATQPKKAWGWLLTQARL